ncbi:MAG TPA: trehalase family glycosidase [Anaerolineales bacterium]|nr:trehalase family glycosidase [Anaerolineales bacterium]
MAKNTHLASALFQAVQIARIFPDSKTFADSTPKHDLTEISAKFQQLLADFVAEHFELPAPADTSQIGRHPSALVQVDRLWDVFTRPAQNPPPNSTLLALPYPYVVVGGRFGEIFYWDSYFTMEGLAASGRLDLLEYMVGNFAHLLTTYGHIPNGSRTYFLSRSQPPFFYLMLKLLAREKGLPAVLPYLPALEAEYRFWMADLPPTHAPSPSANTRTVRLSAQHVLNRYWDTNNLPREEALAEDSQLFAQASPTQQAGLFRNLRAGAESGWDFSSRWLADGKNLVSIQTTSILPVDLNCLMMGMERTLAEWLAETHPSRAQTYANAANQRQVSISQYCWDETQGWFFDYQWEQGTRTACWSLAGVFPLYCQLATPAQAQRVVQQIAEKFLQPGGLVTTLNTSHEQWDCPNGWAPLQWVAIQGLRNYQFHSLANEIAQRFSQTVTDTYQVTGKFLEKYNVVEPTVRATGGEYVNQEGFGWTNGVLRALCPLS